MFYNLFNRLTNKNKLKTMLLKSEKQELSIGIKTFEDINRMIKENRFAELIKKCEENFSKNLNKLADIIADNSKKIRLICIAGPSSSGKTTTSFRLQQELLKHGIRSIPVAMDDYFKNREETPKNENGDYDFEDLEALDLNLLNDHLSKLIYGEEVQLPSYNFKTGKKEFINPPLKITQEDILIIEGIHGMNHRVTQMIPRKKKFFIYATAMPRIRNHKGHFFHSTDFRFIRRIVRDSLFRGYGAKETIERWSSVIKGEQKNIFPYQNNADFMINTALSYEYPVLKRYAFDLLVEINKSVNVFMEARKLLSVLNYFSFAREEDISQIPKDSISREFIGGSCFSY